MSHGSKGKKGKGSGKLPVIPGLPILDEITDEDLRHIGQHMHAGADGPSLSRVSIPSRAKIRRRKDPRQRRPRRRS